MLTKSTGISIEKIIEASIQATDALLTYNNIPKNHKKLLSQL